MNGESHLAEETQPQSSTEGQPSDSTESQEPEVSGASTLEEVEAYWRKRMSNSDKAHAAEAKTLREQLAKSAAEAGTGSQSQGDAQALQELQQKLQAAESRATAAELKAKYPLAVESVGAASVHMDEAALAALNERLNFDAGAPRRINDSNNPARQAPAGEKPLNQKTREELLADLAKMPSPWG